MGESKMREEIIKMAREAGSIDSEDVIETVYRAFAADEREACAKVADEFDPQMKMSNYGQVIANRIRARGNT